MKSNTLPTKKVFRPNSRSFMWSSIFVCTVLAVFIASKTAHAGLISYIHSFFGGEQVSAKIAPNIQVANSQTIALLQAPTNPNVNTEKVSGSLPMVGNVLVADIVLSETALGLDTNTQISSYVVREGDTLSGIANMFGVSSNTIMWANDIAKASSLRVGQSLIILPVTGINYTVKKGDTIRSIALSYKADIDEVLLYNELSLDTKLTVGQTIIIPDAELHVSVPTKYVVKDNPAHDTNGPNYVGYYSRPVVGGVRTQGLHGYNGIDIAAPVGTPIYAAAAGKVIVSISGGGWNGGYGNLVIVSHGNGTQTVYAHNSKNLVSVGESVEKGQKIALMGATGKATGSHVHFEIRGAKNPF